MQGKIGLEEHFAIPETLSDSKGFLGDAVWPSSRSGSWTSRTTA
jgi:hypothetical protein